MLYSERVVCLCLGDQISAQLPVALRLKTKRSIMVTIIVGSDRQYDFINFRPSYDQMSDLNLTLFL